MIADAWRGDAIRGAVERFLEMASGRGVESVPLPGALEGRSLDAGGGADVVAYVGHNGLLDFSLPEEPAAAGLPYRRGAIVLACASRQGFTRRLEARGAAPLLLTGGLVAAEAYTLDAALRAWFSGASLPALHEAAARAYDRYQHCGVGAAKRLFAAGP